MKAARPSSPYKGLAPFGDSALDALFFFGREREREVIVANMLASRLTLVYGESGVGKSSLLAAGVARELRFVAPEAPVVVHDVWSGSLEGMFDLVHDTREGYLILDQFEEYFLYQVDVLERELPDLLRDSRVNVLISLREDALAELNSFKARTPAVFANQIRLEHLDRAAARDAVLGPVARWNELTDDDVEVEPALVEAVLDEVAAGRVDGRADDRERIEAPYLQLVLEKIWQQERSMQSRVLRLETLRTLGGAGAIVRDHLQSALGAFSSADQDIAAELFQHLVTPSGTKIALRAADLAEYAHVPEATVSTILDALTSDRIVHSVAGSDRYEIFHDVLVEPVQAWRLQRRLERERRVARRRQRRLLAIAVAAAIALAIVAAIALFALAQRGHARAQAQHARAGQLSANALADLGRDPVRSLELALSAVRLERTPRIADVLRTTLIDSHLRLVLPARAAVTAASFDRSGRRVIVGSAHGNAVVYDARTGHRRFVLHVGGNGVTAASFSKNGKAALAAGNGRVLVRAAGGGSALVLHHQGVRAAAFTPDGRQVATGGRDGKVRLWRTRDGRLLRTLAIGGDVRALDVSSSRLAAGWSDANGAFHVALIDTGDGQSIATLDGAVPEFSGNGALLATSGTDSYARVYNADRGTFVAMLPHGGRVTAVDFSPSGARLATASSDGAARVWNIARSQRLLLMAAGTETLESIRYSGNGKFIVTGGGDGIARIWDARNSRELVTLAGHRDAVVDASFSLGARSVITASFDGTARIWDTGLANQLTELGRARGGFAKIGLLQGGTLAYAAGHDGAVHVWRVRGGAPVANLEGPAPLDDAAGVGRLVASVDDGGVAKLWRLPSHVAKLKIRVPSPGRRVALSPNGRMMLVAGGRVAQLIDVASGHRLASVHLDGRVTDAELARDGRFVTASDRGTVAAWSRAGNVIRRFATPRARVVAIALSPDGRLVAAADRKGVARIWSIESGRLQHALQRASTPLSDIEFSPDGRLVATAAIGGDVRLWSVEHGILLHVLRGHTGRVARVAFSPDGRWIATAGPTSVGLWEVLTGGFLFYLRGHTGQVEDVAFAPDGKHIATASVDGTARMYPCDVCGSVYELAQLAHERLAHVARDLTVRQRKRYLGG